MVNDRVVIGSQTNSRGLMHAKLILVVDCRSVLSIWHSVTGHVRAVCLPSPFRSGKIPRVIAFVPMHLHHCLYYSCHHQCTCSCCLVMSAAVQPKPLSRVCSSMVSAEADVVGENGGERWVEMPPSTFKGAMLIMHYRFSYSE